MNLQRRILVRSAVTADEATGKDRFSLLVATPSHRGEFCTAYMHSVVGLQEHCLTNGIGFDTAMAHVTSIDRARNALASVFLWQTNATHLLLVDGDMGFNVDELVKMFEWRDKDVVAAMYPRKKLDWSRVKQIVLSNPDIDPAELPNLAVAYDTFELTGETREMPVGDKPVPVAAIGAGLMLISRQCLLRLIDEANLPAIEQHPLTGGNMYEFFKAQIVNGRQMGGDFHFCNLVRRYGGEVLGCPWIRVTHIGQYSYAGDLKGLARHGLKG
jgi:hypothetical protein